MDALFDDAESPIEPLAGVQRSASSPETRERYAVLKTKRKGETWEESGASTAWVRLA